jgi:hypothetical protein
MVTSFAAQITGSRANEPRRNHRPIGLQKQSQFEKNAIKGSR